MADASSGLASLSGCLIGIEFAGAFAKFGRPDEITLLATGNLGDLYECAFEQCAISVTRQNAEKAGMQGLYRAATLLWPANTRAQVQKGVR